MGINLGDVNALAQIFLCDDVRDANVVGSGDRMLMLLFMMIMMVMIVTMLMIKIMVALVIMMLMIIAVGNCG